jgi:hypothetical protein
MAFQYIMWCTDLLWCGTCSTQAAAGGLGMMHDGIDRLDRYMRSVRANSTGLLDLTNVHAVM